MVDGDLPSPKLTAKPPENGSLVQMIRFLSGPALFSRALADSFSLSVILDENQVTKKSHKILGGGNSNVFYVHPENWGNDPI